MKSLQQNAIALKMNLREINNSDLEFRYIIFNEFAIRTVTAFCGCVWLGIFSHYATFKILMLCVHVESTAVVKIEQSSILTTRFLGKQAIVHDEMIKPTIWVPIRCDKNQAVQSQKQVGNLKFRI